MSGFAGVGAFYCGGRTVDWGQRIRSYRKRSGLTQEALAEAFGVEPRTVRRW